MTLVTGFVVVIFGLLCVGLIAIVPIAIIAAQRRAEERRQAVAGFAHHREWNYVPNDPGLPTRFRGAPFGRGSGRRATNVLTGTHEGRHFVAFDYHYTTSSGDQQHTHVHSVIALNLGVHAPDLAVGPTGTLRRWVDSLTGKDIAIGDPAFDEHFTVHSPAPEFAVDVLLSDVRQVMQHHPDLAWRITDDSLLVIRAGQHQPAEIEAKLLVMDAILARIPTHVWDRLGGEQAR